MRKIDTNNEPERIRRKLAEAYRRESESTRWKKKERTSFAHMAEAWNRTLQAREKK